MLIMPEAVIRQLMTSMMTAARNCRDHNGEIPLIKTVEERTMRAAAKAAIALMTGEAVDTEVPQFTEHRRR